MTAPSALARLGGAARREAGFIATSRVMLLALVVVPFCAIAIVAAMLSQGALQALPVAVVDNARTSESQALVRLLSGRPEVRIAAQPVSDAAAEAAMRRGEGAPCVLNAANEVAVEAFLADRIGFLDIARVVEATLARIDRESGLSEPASLASAIELDGWARKIASACL